MKRLRVPFIAGLLTFVALFAVGAAGVASAHSFRSGDSISVRSGQTVRDTLFIAGRNVDVSGEVFGDVFAAGQTVTVTGKVHGDVIAAGQTVTVGGTVDGDVRLAGQTINVSAVVEGSATIAGQSFTLESEGSVGQDITAGATDNTINGKVGRDAAVGGATVTINSEIGRDIQSQTDNLTLASGAKVGGNVDYTSHEQVNQDRAAEVAGKVTRHDPPPKDEKPAAEEGFKFGWFVYCLLAMLFTAMALALLVPRWLERVTDRAFPTPWLALLVGLIANFVLPAALFMLAITVVGIPFAIIVGLAWLLILMLSGPFFAYYIGRLIFSGQRNALLTMLVGASILLVAYFIPFLGFLALLAAVWIGTGLQLLSGYQRLVTAPSYQYEGNEGAETTRPKPVRKR